MCVTKEQQDKAFCPSLPDAKAETTRKPGQPVTVLAVFTCCHCSCQSPNCGCSENYTTQRFSSQISLIISEFIRLIQMHSSIQYLFIQFSSCRFKLHHPVVCSFFSRYLHHGDSIMLKIVHKCKYNKEQHINSK